MNRESVTASAGVLRDRAAILEILADGSTHKAAVTEQLDWSRSTVDRAVEELQAEGYVERATAGFVLTTAGRLVMDRYRACVRETDRILAARDVLAPLGGDCQLHPSLITTGTVESEDDSYQFFERIAEATDGADRYRVLVPRFLDSRHVRLCHARAANADLDVSIVTTRDELERLQQEFPGLTGELARSNAIAVCNGRGPQYCLGIVERNDDSEVIVLTYDGDGLRGSLSTSDSVAVAWASDRFRTEHASATPATEICPDTVSSGIGTFNVDSNNTRIRQQGFVALEDRYFDGRSPLEQSISYRAGLGLPEVAAGQSVDRYSTTDERSMTDELLDRLRAGRDLAVLGPPGSGKSTLCKRVACEWFELDLGQVYYREGGGPDRFDQPAILEQALSETDEPALVVVEDAVRPTARSVFSLARAFADDPGVVFLLDARESEWQDPVDGSVGSGIDAFRRSEIETVAMPPLDERECRQLVESIGDGAGTVSTDELLDAARTARRDESSTPDAIYRVCHRLARYADPLGWDEPSAVPTTLEADVQRVHERLAEVGTEALDVGVYLALLSVAGCHIYPTSLRTLAVGDVVDRSTLGTVRADFQGRLLFSSDTGGSLRGPHENWAARFLAFHVDAVGPDRAHQRVGRCVSTLLSLAADPDRRAELAAGTTGGTPLLERIVRDPSGWASETVDRLFAAGRSHARLAPLFGVPGDSAIELPSVCPERVRLRCLAHQGAMNGTAGDLDRAAAAYERLERLACTDAAEFCVEALLGRAAVVRQQGRFEAADETANRALEIARDRTDTQALVRAHVERGTIATERGDLDAAETILEDCRAVLDPVEDPELHAEFHRQRGLVARDRADYDRAEAALERSLERYRSAGDRCGEATVRGYLGQIANEQGEFDLARNQFRRGLERARNAGARSVQADMLKNLGVLAYLRDDYDDAERYFQQALPIAESIDDPSVLLPLLLNSATIDVERDAYVEAEQAAERALELAADVGATRYEGSAHRTLAVIARHLDDADGICRHAREAMGIAEEVGDQRLAVDARQFLASGRCTHGDPTAARERAEEAVALAREIDHTQKVGEALTELARAEVRLGELAAAREHAEESRSIHADAGVAAEAASLEIQGRAALADDDLDSARSPLERAVQIYRDDGHTRGVIRSLAALARVQRNEGDLDAAHTTATEALDLARSSDAARATARAAIERAAVARDRELLAEAVDAVEVAREAVGTVEDPLVAARLAVETGRLAHDRHDVETATERFERAARLYRESGADHLAAEVEELRERVSVGSSTTETDERSDSDRLRHRE